MEPDRVARSLACLFLIALSVGQAIPLNETVSNNTTVPQVGVNGTVTNTEVLIATPGPNVTNSTQNSTIVQSAPAPPQKPPPQKPPPALGLPCNTTLDCKANFSSCTDNVCSCTRGYIESTERLRCLMIAQKLGEDCSEDKQCSHGLAKEVGETTCLNFICSCAIGMSIIDGKCQGPKVLNSNCTSDDDCSIKKSFCTEGFCTCVDGHVPNMDNNLCLPVALQLQKMSGCSEDIQCQEMGDDAAICIIGTAGGECQCKPGMHLFNNKCIPYKDLGADCSHDEECISKDFNMESNHSRFCNQNICSCNVGFVKVDDVCKGSATQNTLAFGLLSFVVLFWISCKN